MPYSCTRSHNSTMLTMVNQPVLSQERDFSLSLLFSPEEVIKLLHAGGRDSLCLHVREREACLLDDMQEAGLGLCILFERSTEDEHSFGGPVDKFLMLPQHTEHTGVGHCSEGGFVASVS